MLFCFRCCYLCIGLAVVVVSSILVSLFMRHGAGHSILVLLFMQHANNVGWHFDFGLGVAFFSMTLLVPPLLSMFVLLFMEQSCCFGDCFVPSVVVSLSVQCSCKWCRSFYFGVVICVTCK